MSLKYLSYSYTYDVLMLLISTFHNSTYTGISQNKYDSLTNTKILTKRLCVCSAYCSVSFLLMQLFYFFL